MSANLDNIICVVTRKRGGLEEHELQLTINPSVEPHFWRSMEIEMLRAQRTVTRRGQLHFVVQVDAEKAAHIKAWLTRQEFSHLNISDN